MKVDMSAALPDFMCDCLGWADFNAIQAAYTIDVMLMAIDSYMHRTYHLARFTLDAFFLSHPQSEQAETIEY